MLGGVARVELARRFGTPLVVYDEATLRAQARAYRAAAPDALIVYGTKAFPSVAILRLLGRGRARRRRLDARRARVRPARRDPGRRGSSSTATTRRTSCCAPRPRRTRCSSSDSLERGRARRAAGRARDARARDARDRGGHARGDQDRAPRLEVRAAARRGGRGDPRARRLRRACTSTSARSCSHLGAALMTVDWMAAFAARVRAELDWTPQIVDLGGGLGVRHVARGAGRRDRRLRRRPDASELAARVGAARASRSRSVDPRAGPLARRARGRDALHGRRGQARRGGDDATSRSTAACPTTRGPRCTARATRRCSRTVPTRQPTGALRGRGKHCESGDVLIERVELPEPRRGDLLAIPVDRRVHAGDELDLQRGAAAGGRARRGRRGDADPPARDDRRPARARGLAPRGSLVRRLPHLPATVDESVTARDTPAARIERS